MRDHLLLIAGMTLVTYIPRALPLMFLSSKELPTPFFRWLEMIPPAVLAALLAPELLLTTKNGVKTLFLSTENVMLLAALPTMLFCWYTKSFFGTVAVGMLLVALLRFLGT